MTVAAGIEIMPVGVGPKSLVQIPSSIHRIESGEALAGGTNPGSALGKDADTASSVWHLVLASLGVRVSAPDAQEHPNSELGSVQQSTTEIKSAKEFASVTVGSWGQIMMAPPTGQVNSLQELRGRVEIQPQANIEPAVLAGKAFLQKLATPEAGNRFGNSQEVGAKNNMSDSEGAASAHKRRNSPAIEEPIGTIPRVASDQVALASSQGIQQPIAGEAHDSGNLRQGKSVFGTVQPESYSVSQLNVPLGGAEIAAPRASSDSRERGEGIQGREVAANSEIARQQGATSRAGTAALSKADVSAYAETSLPQGTKDSAKAPASLEAEVKGGEKPIGQCDQASQPIGLPTSPQIRAMRNNQELDSLPAAPMVWPPLAIGVATSTISTSSVHADVVRLTSTSDRPQLGSRGPKQKSDAITNNREGIAIPRASAKVASTQSASPTSMPGNGLHENPVPAAAYDAVAPVHPRGTAANTSITGQMIPAPASADTQSAESVLSVGLSGNSAGVPAVLSSQTPGATSESQGAPKAAEAFTSLDAEGSNRVTWVHAGAQRAEAGFQDPHLGWVSVRAEVSGGTIHAAVVPASAEAALAMGGHLEGLNAYLGEHHSALETVTLSAPSGKAYEPGESGTQERGTREGADDGSGQGANGENGQGAGSAFAEKRLSDSDSQESRVRGSSAAANGAQQEVPTRAYALGGRISVMA